MTIAIDPKLLSAAYAALKAIPDRDGKIPVTNMLHVERGESGIVVTATDTGIEVSVVLEAEADFQPACLPPYLIETAGQLAGQKVEIAIDERNATVKAGRARFTAPILPGADFPRLSPAFDTVVDLPGAALARIMESAARAAATAADKDPRFYLEGVFLQTAKEPGSDEVRLVATATNGHRLHSASTEAGSARLPEGIIVPNKAVAEIARIAAKAEGAVRLQACGSAVSVEAAGEKLTSKLIEATYPDWRRVVPAPTGVTAIVDLAELLGAVGRVVKVMEASRAGKQGDKAKLGTAIRLAEDGEWLTVCAAGQHSAAEAQDAVKAEFSGAWGVHGVSAKNLLATLTGMRERGAETVSIDGNDAASPLRIESVTDDDFFAIVMPMRV